MKEKKIINLLSTKKINMLEMVREINMKGLSAPSLYNKMNPSKPNIKFRESELIAIEHYLRKLFNNGLRALE